LDALCRRYGIDNSHRTKHGALLDSELLAEVYIELIGGKQAALGLEVQSRHAADTGPPATVDSTARREPPLPSRPGAEAPGAHEALVAEIGDQAIWRSLSTGPERA